MRARYYNPQIKRFINQDILTGNIGNNKSLNRYSYVEGNPVSYTDPFGLSPIHFILDVAGIFFPPADWLNAGLYLLEGNYKEAAKSIIYSIPGSDVAGFLGKFVKSGSKASKYVDAIAGGISTGGNILATFAGAEDLGNGIAYAIEKYGVQGEKFSAETIAETGLIVLSAAQLGSSAYHYNKGIKSSDAPNTEKLSAGNTNLPDADDLIASKAGEDSSNYVYRALNQKDYERYTNGLGLEAKNPNGSWSLEEHLVDGSGKLSWENDPYISTTSDLSVAKGFNQSGNGYGIVKIDLNKVNSSSYKGYEIYPRVNGKEGLPYHYSIWQQEISVYQSIPFEAIVDYYN